MNNFKFFLKNILSISVCLCLVFVSISFVHAADDDAPGNSGAESDVVTFEQIDSLDQDVLDFDNELRQLASNISRSTEYTANDIYVLLASVISSSKINTNDSNANSKLQSIYSALMIGNTSIATYCYTMNDSLNTIMQRLGYSSLGSNITFADVLDDILINSNSIPEILDVLGSRPSSSSSTIWGNILIMTNALYDSSTNTNRLDSVNNNLSALYNSLNDNNGPYLYHINNTLNNTYNLLSTLDSKVNSINNTVSVINTALGTIHSDISETNSKIDNLNTTTSHIDSDIHNIKQFLQNTFYFDETITVQEALLVRDGIYLYEYDDATFSNYHNSSRVYNLGFTFPMSFAQETGQILLKFSPDSNNIFSNISNVTYTYTASNYYYAFNNYQSGQTGTRIAKSIPNNLITINSYYIVDNNLYVIFDVDLTGLNIFDSNYTHIALPFEKTPYIGLQIYNENYSQNMNYTYREYFYSSQTITTSYFESFKDTLELFKNIYASEDLIQAKENQQSYENQAISSFTGNGSSAASLSDLGDASSISDVVSSGLNPGGSVSNALAVFDASGNFYYWFSNQNSININTIGSNGYLVPSRSTQENNAPVVVNFYDQNLIDIHNLLGGN